MVSKTKKIRLTKEEQKLVNTLLAVPDGKILHFGRYFFTLNGPRGEYFDVESNFIPNVVKRGILMFDVEGFQEADQVDCIPFKLNPTVL